MTILSSYYQILSCFGGRAIIHSRVETFYQIVSFQEISTRTTPSVLSDLHAFSSRFKKELVVAWLRSIETIIIHNTIKSSVWLSSLLVMMCHSFSFTSLVFFHYYYYHIAIVCDYIVLYLFSKCLDSQNHILLTTTR